VLYAIITVFFYNLEVSMFLVTVWTFAELLVGLVYLKWYVTEMLIDKFGELRERKRMATLDAFDKFDALAYGPLALSGALGWLGGSIYGAFYYPKEGWWLVGLFSGVGVVGAVILAVGIPFATYWTVVWTWRGLRYLLPERLQKSR
jgi:hypothetical protein